MGKRKSRAKPPPKKRMDKLDTVFSCPFCNHGTSVECRIDMKNLIGEAACRICQESFSTTITAAGLDNQSEAEDAKALCFNRANRHVSLILYVSLSQTHSLARSFTPIFTESFHFADTANGLMSANGLTTLKMMVLKRKRTQSLDMKLWCSNSLQL
ncbi:hypothetical protein TIFTF001_012844 [Ficus carica]|uniref:Transcription elongation factor 1 homolog n=1 Tax=Ficus carica TaxID=3494 RepID=A0AA87ZTY5_FICCA|nr:hypothetical protein TIFTF001_012844 [Ficus carica]